MNQWAWLYGTPISKGILKAQVEDFVVQEDLGFEPDGEGEHLLVHLRKVGCNTQFVARQLARFAGIPPKAVSYAGLKDRHAVTEQWFCLHVPGKVKPDLSGFELAGCEVLSVAEHRRKLRIGALKGNRFHLIVRGVTAVEDIEQRLSRIVAQGVPNYFAEQRFGRGGQNFQQALRWAEGELQVKEREKRSFYLSAARSALFNELVSQRIALGAWQTVWSGDALQLRGRGSWFVAQAEELEELQQRVEQQELLVTAALPGRGNWGTLGTALEFEERSLAHQTGLIELLRREKVDAARRAVLLLPEKMQWQWKEPEVLSLSFSLPAGSYATSVMRELIIRDESLELSGMDEGE